MAKESSSEGRVRSGTPGSERIPRPDRGEFDRQLGELKTELAKRQDAVKQARQAADNASATNKDSTEWQALQDELKAAKAERESVRQGSNGIESEMKKIDSRVQQNLRQIQALRPKGGSGPKSASELDAMIVRLEKLLESGDLSIKKEAETLREARRLKQQRQQFVEVDKIQAQIDADKAQSRQLHSTIDHASIKAAQAKIAAVNAKLDAHRSQRQARRQSVDKVYENLRASQKSVDEVRKQLDALRADFNARMAGFREHIKKQQAAREAEERAAKAETAKAKKIADARTKLDEAKLPAFDAHIQKAESLLLYFDPSLDLSGSAPEQQGLKLGTLKASRTVEPIAEGTKVVNKTREAPPLSRKQLKHKTKAKTDAPEKKLQLDLSIIEDLASLNIGMPTNASEVDDTKAKLREKIEFYKANNERVTKERTERAQKDFEKLSAAAEAEAKAEAEAPSETKADAKADTKTEAKADSKAESTATPEKTSE